MKLRVGKVSFSIQYIVDLDNKKMVERAKDTIEQDLMTSVIQGKDGPVRNLMEVEEVVGDPDIGEEDIASFLLDGEEMEVEDGEEARVAEHFGC